MDRAEIRASRRAAEAIKDNASLPGKVVIADTLDRRGNNIPGYADLTIPIGQNLSDWSFAPINLDINTGAGSFDVSKAHIRFSYSAADPKLVSSTDVKSDIPRYDPGSTGALRLWSAFPTRELGDYLPSDTPIPASELFDGGARHITIYAEGITPTDPSNTRIQVDVDPTGNGNYVFHDYIRLTVASVRLAYTDVSGLSHNINGWSGVLGVPRIPATTEPDGIAADGKYGVDDGALMLISVLGSPAITQLANDQHHFSVHWGEFYPTIGFTDLQPNDGEYWAANGGFIPNTPDKLHSLGISLIGEHWTGNLSSFTVLDNSYYKPPVEFDLSRGATDTAQFRRIPLQITMSLNDETAAAGGKAQGLMLTRPPLVLVHGMNSSPGVWEDTNDGATPFNVAMSGYPTTYIVDHRGIDPMRPDDGRTYGEGEITDMYASVRDTIAEATSSYRSGDCFPPNPYAVAPPSGVLPSGALITDQKVDVVAHSYGGLLTRWYIEQSGDFSNRRDVRKLIELGTPNLGSPLANMILEILRNPIVGNARENITHIATLRTVVGFLNYFGKKGWGGLPNMLASPPNTPFPFFEDASVDSPRMVQLNSDPFNNDVSYAAVQGTKPVLTVLGVPTNLYSKVEPTSTSGENYFPWLYLFDGVINDSIVPVWSASLGVVPYNFSVTDIHTHLVQNPSVQSKVLSWLNDPNVPLGFAQRAAWLSSTPKGNEPPINDRNAYQQPDGYSLDAQGRLTGGGLNPNAIVGVSFPDSGMNTATWDTVANVGIKTPILTGMMPYGDMGFRDFTIVADYAAPVPQAHSPFHDMLKKVVSPPPGAFHVTPDQWLGANNSTWLAFSLTIGGSAGGIGRRHNQHTICWNWNLRYHTCSPIPTTTNAAPGSVGRSPPAIFDLLSFIH